MVDQLNNNHPDARFTYINAYGIFQDMITNPSRFGIYLSHTREVFLFNVKETEPDISFVGNVCLFQGSQRQTQGVVESEEMLVRSHVYRDKDHVETEMRTYFGMLFTRPKPQTWLSQGDRTPHNHLQTLTLLISQA